MGAHAHTHPNALQAIALANGLRRGPSLWSYDGQAQNAFLPLLPHTAYRRSALQAMYKNMESEIENLTQPSKSWSKLEIIPEHDC